MSALAIGPFRWFCRPSSECSVDKQTTQSHPFIERLIGTVRREYLDQTLFWTAADLEQKLRSFQQYFNRERVHSGLDGKPPDPTAAPTLLKFDSYCWQQHCRGLYQTPIAA
jgi:putative transposase